MEVGVGGVGEVLDEGRSDLRGSVSDEIVVCFVSASKKILILGPSRCFDLPPWQMIAVNFDEWKVNLPCCGIWDNL